MRVRPLVVLAALLVTTAVILAANLALAVQGAVS
jgi:hypothetical protein